MSRTSCGLSNVKRLLKSSKPSSLHRRCCQNPDVENLSTYTSALKSQVLADFITECSTPDPSPEVEFKEEGAWKLYVDDSSNNQMSGAGLMLISPENLKFQYSLRFKFKASNNEAEYETVITGLKIANEMKVEKLVVYSDSQLVVSQITGEFEAKGETMIKYLKKVRRIPRSENVVADSLSKLASGTIASSVFGVKIEEIEEKSIADEKEVNQIDQEDESWMSPMVTVELSNEVENEDALRANLDLTEEQTDVALVKIAAYQQKIAKYYNRRVKNKLITKGDLVLRKVEASRKGGSGGKLAPNWEGPYVVKEVARAGTYKLQDLDGKIIPRTWNADHLKKYYQ
ncbi:hypothetical protein CCACVL1_23055 [Corchorus capsularis]|uniref:RNase H type-1 domain-containing protein n=1 Tax=Corchorus capsularis TaxID=210143 RepID=A0A1R3GVB5_COCAP|nr:hypothetical protein CCACVL1_23055 [Corchorus capsularis]